MDPVEITAGRLHLRPWTAYDESAVFEACQDPDIQHWTTVPSPYTRADAHAWVNTVSPGMWTAGTGASFAVVDSLSAQVLASVGLSQIAGDQAHIGYWCAPEARGQGVVSDAVEAVCRWGFGALGLDRITWLAEVGNWGSRQVAEKCGFTVEGVRRRELRHRGTAVDAWIGSLLATDEVVDRRALPGPPLLTDGVVTLRGWNSTDGPDVARACDDPLTATWLPVPVPYTEAAGDWYVGTHCPLAWSEGTAAELAVTDAASGELLGACGLKLGGRAQGYGEVGYWTAPWARGRGVAGRAAALSAGWGLEVLGLNRVELLADVDNLASQRAAEKAGFVREGVARRSRPDRDGTARDMVLFSLTTDR